MNASKPTRNVITAIDGTPIDRWKADHARFKAMTRKREIAHARRVAFWTMPAMSAMAIACLLMTNRLYDMHGITWIASNPIDLLAACSAIGMPATFMALAMALNWEACNRIADHADR